jgi:opacity protein-like surface antigen
VKKEYKMKKLLTITSSLLTAGSIFAEITMPALTVDSKIEFNTARVSEGHRLGDHNFAPSVEVGVPLLGAGEFYVGLDSYLLFDQQKHAKGLNVSNSQVNAKGRDEVAPYIGFSYDVTDMFTIDLGYTYHRYSDRRSVLVAVGGREFRPFNDEGKIDIFNTEDGSVNGALSIADFNVEKDKDTPWDNSAQGLRVKRNGHEIYAGVMVDVLLSPAVYFAYDCTQKKANIEGTINYTFDLGSVGANGFAIDLGTKIGYSRVNKPYGVNRATQVAFAVLDDGGDIAGVEAGGLFDKKGWGYIGANADLVYSLNEHTKARAGVGLSFNSAKKNSWVNDFNSKKHNVWFSSAVEFSF